VEGTSVDVVREDGGPEADGQCRKVIQHSLEVTKLYTTIRNVNEEEGGERTEGGGGGGARGAGGEREKKKKNNFI